MILEVIKENASLLIDGDIGHYHTFDIGDIIEQGTHDVRLNGSTILRGDYANQTAQYTIRLGKLYGGVSVSSRVSVWKLIELGYAIDITKQMLRNQKIKELGI